MQQTASSIASPEKTDPSLERRIDSLKKRIERSDAQIARIFDPMYGPVGQMLLDAFHRTGAIETVGTKQASSIYNFYFYPTKKPRLVEPGGNKEKEAPVPMNFTNSIEYNVPDSMSDAEFFLLRCQKMFFATQPLTALPLHADPFNSETTLVLGPDDYAKRKVRLHQDAAVGQAYFAYLESRNNPAVRAAGRGLILSPDVFGALRGQPGATLDSACREAATLFAVSTWNGSISNVRECLHTSALSEYEFIIRTRRNEGDKLTFARMDTADGRDAKGRLNNDILTIGEGAILNPFGRGDTLYPEFRDEPMSLYTMNRLARIRQEYGIRTPQTLRTIREELAKIPLTPEEFISQSRRENVLPHLERWMDDLGPVGRKFNKALAKTQCVETVKREQENNATAVLNTFGYPALGGRSMNNIIEYGDGALKNLAYMFSAAAHEKIHILQVENAPALHANPYNGNTEFILSIEDFLTVGGLMEEGAYPHGAYLGAEAAKTRPAIRNGMQFSVVTVDDFNTIREQQNGDLNKTFRAAANFAAQKVGDWVVEGEFTTALDNWHSLRLKEYDDIIGKRLRDAKAAGKEIVFVRLDMAGHGDANDILPIGIGPGPNPFGKDGVPYEEFTRLPPFSKENQAEIDAQRRKFGLPERDTLKTLGEALAEKGLTKAQYIANSRGDHLPPLPKAALPRELKI